MIKFFRNIRYRMARDNQFFNYSKYAVGEIVLVVLGILIAIQINEWNDHRKDLLKKKNLLKSLEVEFIENLEQLDTVLSYDVLVVESSLEFLKLKADDSIVNNAKYMAQLLQNTSWNWTYDPQNGALRSGISSGDINLIKNEHLINALFGWRDVVVDAKENEERSLTTRLEAKSVIEKHVRNVDYRSTDRKELGQSKFKSDYKGLILDPLFEDYISDRYARMRDAVLELKTVRELNIQILELIREAQKQN